MNANQLGLLVKTLFDEQTSCIEIKPEFDFKIKNGLQNMNWHKFT